MTSLLLLAIGAMFVLETLAGGSTNERVLLALGANYAPYVRAGEYWRLLASMFLHIGLLHLLVNGWALYQLCSLMEIWVGSWRLAVVYFLSGIGASIASVLWTQGLSAGASGAIFGVLGALITFLVRRHHRLRPEARSLLFQLLFWAGVNIFLGATMPGIDNFAHLGGFAVGLVSGLMVGERPPRYAVEP